MGLLIDIRKYNMDNFMNDLINSSKIKKNWYGKRIDNYWSYIEENMIQVNLELNANIISDLFIYFIDKLNFKELLSEYSKILSDNRSCFVIKLIIDDKIFLLDKINSASFIENFEEFCKELNGEYYNYDLNMIKGNINKFKIALEQIDEDNGLLINFC